MLSKRVQMTTEHTTKESAEDYGTYYQEEHITKEVGEDYGTYYQREYRGLRSHDIRESTDDYASALTQWGGGGVKGQKHRES